MSRPAVLYVSFDQLNNGKGAAVHISKFAEALQSRYQLTLITLSSDGCDHQGHRQQARWLEFAVNDANLLDRVANFRARLADHLKDHRYQAIHFRSIWEGRVIQEANNESANRARLIYEVNGFPSIELKYHYPRLADNPALLLKLAEQESLLLLSADRIITPAAVTKAFIESLGIHGNKITVIPNGADIELFTPAVDTARSAALAESADHCLKLVYIGTQAPWQGLDELFAAVAMILPEEPLQLLIVGHARKEWAAAHQRLVKEYAIAGAVRFIDSCPQAEVAGYLQAADIAVAPLAAVDRNIVQGCSPIKLFEYAACGKAIVVADLPVAREIFTDGEHALFYQPGRPAELAAQLRRLAADVKLRRQLGAAARELIATRYRWQQAQQSLLETYQALLD